MSEALKRMASEYRANAKLLLGRINELKAELARTSRNSGAWTRLRGRILALEAIYSENIGTAAYLENYHGRG